MNAVVAVQDVTVRFGGVTALEAVSFDVQGGELLGLIGPNGAGKTTMMRVITGVVRPAPGAVVLGGNDVTASPPHARIRVGLAISQQLVKPFRSMTVVQNVALALGKDRTANPLRALFSTGRHDKRDEALGFLDRVGIADAADEEPDSLPLGYLKRLEVARALALGPKLLLLDEPLAGLNHGEAHALAETIKELNADGLTMLLIEHNLGEVARICPRLVVLDNGRLLAEGATASVLANQAVQEAYLGSKGDAAA